VTTASKQHAQFKEPIPERGVLLSVQRTISRDENGSPQKIMALEIGGSMVKNIPENAAARASDDERAEKRHFSGPVPRSMAAIAAGLGSSAGAATRANGREANGLVENQMNAGGLDVCVPARNSGKMRNVDFGDAIGKELQNLYDDLVAQPVPDRFVNLLNQLEKNMVSSGLSNGAPGERE
jgi:hypothetical protein